MSIDAVVEQAPDAARLDLRAPVSAPLLTSLSTSSRPTRCAVRKCLRASSPALAMGVFSKMALISLLAPAYGLSVTAGVRTPAAASPFLQPAVTPANTCRRCMSPRLEAATDDCAVVPTAGSEDCDGPLTRDPPFGKVMAANRAEIAVRIARACTELNIQTVAIYGYEDRYSMHRWGADESYMLDKEAAASPISAYLDIDQIISIAKVREGIARIKKAPAITSRRSLSLRFFFFVWLCAAAGEQRRRDPPGLRLPLRVSRVCPGVRRRRTNHRRRHFSQRSSPRVALSHLLTSFAASLSPSLCTAAPTTASPSSALRSRTSTRSPTRPPRAQPRSLRVSRSYLVRTAR